MTPIILALTRAIEGLEAILQHIYYVTTRTPRYLRKFKRLRWPTRLAGYLTKEEDARVAEHMAMWTRRAMRTDPIEPDKIVPAIEALYADAGLKMPVVVVVPSPLVMAFAHGAASALLDRPAGQPTPDLCDRTDAVATAVREVLARARPRDRGDHAPADDPLHLAAARAIDDVQKAIYDALERAMDRAVSGSLHSDTISPPRPTLYLHLADLLDPVKRAASALLEGQGRLDVTESELSAALACRDVAGDAGLRAVMRWQDVPGYAAQIDSEWRVETNTHGGHLWSEFEVTITAARDVLGLRLPVFERYAHWEACAIHGGFRVMHPDYCLVSDFPEVLRMDAQRRPHCEDGPSHRWRDGWALYHWHSVPVPAAWIEDRASLTPQVALTWPNIEQRRAACEILGWDAVLKTLDGRIIDENPDPMIGTLIEVTLPGMGLARFLKVLCPTGRNFTISVPPNTETALHAQAWTYGIPRDYFTPPEVRT